MSRLQKLCHGLDVRHRVVFGGVIILAIISVPSPLFAISSANYQIQEDFIGGAGGEYSTSSNYQSRGSMTAPAVGNSASSNFRTQSGATTTSDPTLSFSVSATNVNLGSLSTSLTRTGTATFQVLNYTSYGYLVQTLGTPPTNGSHALQGMTSSGSSQVGTEQFGINLKANTSPQAFGADPVQDPDSSFSFGSAATGYDTANNYKYVPGDVIASGPKSSGNTIYTISYIANIGINTPGGSYSGNQTLVATGTY